LYEVIKRRTAIVLIGGLALLLIGYLLRPVRSQEGSVGQIDQPEEQTEEDQSVTHLGVHSDSQESETSSSDEQAVRPAKALSGQKRSAPTEDASIHIIVRTEAGEAVESAQLTVAGRETRIQVETDTRGLAIPKVLPGEYRILVEEEGFLSQFLYLGIPEQLTSVRREVRLKKGVLVEGVVLNQYSEPVPQARVVLASMAGREQSEFGGQSRGMPGGRREHFRQTETAVDGTFSVYVRTQDHGTFSRRVLSEDGSFRLKSVPTGLLELTIVAQGYDRSTYRLAVEPGRPGHLEAVLKKSPERRRGGARRIRGSSGGRSGTSRSRSGGS
jgi:hypothetical protein